MIGALNAARVEYLIGDAIAEGHGENRVQLRIPIKFINKLSKELEKRDILIPAKIILEGILSISPSARQCRLGSTTVLFLDTRQSC